MLSQSMDIFTERSKEITEKKRKEKGRKEKEERKTKYGGPLGDFRNKSRQNSKGFICVRVQHAPRKNSKKTLWGWSWALSLGCRDKAEEQRPRLQLLGCASLEHKKLILQCGVMPPSCVLAQRQRSKPCWQGKNPAVQDCWVHSLCPLIRSSKELWRGPHKREILRKKKRMMQMKEPWPRR